MSSEEERLVHAALETQRAAIVAHLREIASALHGVRMVEYSRAMYLISGAIELRTELPNGSREDQRERVSALVWAIVKSG